MRQFIALECMAFFYGFQRCPTGTTRNGLQVRCIVVTPGTVKLWESPPGRAGGLPESELAYILARAPGGQMQGAATQAMWFISESRQRSRCPPAAAPRRAAGSQNCNILFHFLT